MSEIERAFAFAGKVQSGPGVDATPTMAADALRLAAPVEVDPDWLSKNEADGEQTGGKGTFPSSIRAGRTFRYRIRRRLRGIGTAYGPAALPEEDALLMAILGTRNVITTSGSEAAEYSGADSGEAVLTCIAQTMSKQFKALDVVPVSASIELEAAKHLVLVVELEGVGIAPTQQVLQAATLDTIVSPIFQGGVFTLDGTALKIAQFNLDFGIAASEAIADGSATDAWSGKVVTDRMPKGRMQVHVTDLATFDPYDACATSEQLALVLGTGPVATQYNRLRIEADNLEILEVKDQVKGGLKVWDIAFKINRANAASVKDPVIIFN